MDRRRKHHVQAAWRSLIAMPVWLAPLLAALSFLLCNALADSPFLTASPAAHWFAWLQYLLPALWLGLGGLLLLARRRGLAASQRQRRLFDGMRRSQFDALLVEALRLRGYQLLDQRPAGELRVEKAGRVWLVHSQAWRSNRVGLASVRDLYWLMQAEGVTQGMLVTAGMFSTRAEQFALARGIRLIDGPVLRRLLQGVSLPSISAEQSVPPAPACPGCGGDMVWRVARQGQHAGKAFWGCMAYPACCGVQVAAEAD